MLLVELANLYTEAGTRPIGFAYLPVRDDVDADNYLRPRTGLVLAPQTVLYLELIDRACRCTRKASMAKTT